jgi:HK97 family phage major capsid protein
MHFVDESNLKHLELMQLGERFAEYGGQRVALTVSRNGGDKHQFMERIMERVRNESVIGNPDLILGFSNFEDRKGYSFCAGVLAQAERKWDRAGMEKSVSDFITTKTGKVPNGLHVPLSEFTRDFNSGTANQAGNLIGTTIDGARTADPLTRVSILRKMGVQFIPGLRETLIVPRFNSSSTVSAKSEIAAEDAIAESTADATFTPKTYRASVLISLQALKQANPALDVAIPAHLWKIINAQLEYDALNGDGTSDTPVGLRYTTGVNDVAGGTDGAQLAWSNLVDLENKADTANAPETDLSGFIVNSATRKWLRNTTRATYQPYIWDNAAKPLLGKAAGVSNILPSNLVKGASGAVCSSVCYSSDWSQMAVGMYGPGIDVLVDRITQASVGKVIIHASLVAGIGVIRPEVFSKMDDAKTA